MAESATDFDQWLAAARAGSREALGEVFDACRRYLLLVAEREGDAALRAKGDASDLVQETFLEAQRDFGQFRGTSQAELLAWLRRLLLNNLGNFSRRYRATAKRDARREVALPDDGSSNGTGGVPAGPSPSASGQAIEDEQAEALQRALARLPDDYRRAIVLRYQDGRSFEEIGRLMGRSPDAARKLWARAMERLRQEWEVPP